MNSLHIEKVSATLGEDEKSWLEATWNGMKLMECSNFKPPTPKRFRDEAEICLAVLEYQLGDIECHWFETESYSS